jgi:hypothetical protein
LGDLQGRQILTIETMPSGVLPVDERESAVPQLRLRWQRAT